MSAADAFVRADGRLVLARPYELSRDEWTRFGGELRRLGYGTERPWQAKDRLAAHCLDNQSEGRPGFKLMPDQQDAAERLFFGKPAENTYDAAQAARLDGAAFTLYGSTDDPDMAGYVTPSGTMLNFSVEGRQRDIDHREVSELFENEPDPPEDEPGGNRACMDRLLSLGFIRLTICGIDLCREPTEAQYRALARAYRFWNDRPVQVEFSSPSGLKVASTAIRPMTPFHEVRGTIESFVRTGFLPGELEADDDMHWTDVPR